MPADLDTEGAHCNTSLNSTMSSKGEGIKKLSQLHSLYAPARHSYMLQENEMI